MHPLARGAADSRLSSLPCLLAAAMDSRRHSTDAPACEAAIAVEQLLTRDLVHYVGPTGMRSSDDDAPAWKAAIQVEQPLTRGFTRTATPRRPEQHRLATRLRCPASKRGSIDVRRGLLRCPASGAALGGAAIDSRSGAY